MTYLANTLIKRSFYLSNIVARNLQTLTDAQQTDGLFLLNSLLSIKAADTRMIPYYNYTSINLVQNQELYFIPNLIEIDTTTFNIDSVRYSMNKISRAKYFGSPRVDNIQSLPFSWHLERTLGGSNLYVYFLPQSNYLLKFIGKFFLDTVTEFTDLNNFFDDFYIEYLRYALANYISDYYDISFPETKMKILREYEQTIMDLSPLDLETEIYSCLGKNSGYNWGDVNTGKGWRP